MSLPISATFLATSLVSAICSVRPGVAASACQRGADLRYDLELTFEEAAFGRQPRSRFRATKPAPNAAEAERRKDRAQPPVRRAMATARFGFSRDSSASPAPAVSATAPGRSSRIRARYAAAKAASSGKNARTQNSCRRRQRIQAAHLRRRRCRPQRAVRPEICMLF